MIPLRGDLYLLQGSDGPLERLTETPRPEIDPQLEPDGSKVAFVREGELYALDVASKAGDPAQPRGRRRADPRPGRVHGPGGDGPAPGGSGGRPTGLEIAYQEADERQIPAYSIVHQGGAEYSVETHRYPFPGAANARVRLGVVPPAGARRPG